MISSPSLKSFLGFALLFILSNFCLIIPAHALSISIHVPEKYTDVQAGERFYFELDVKYPENQTRKDLRLSYEITQADEIIAQAKFLKAIETQASFMDFIVIPESAKSGIATISVGISDYTDLDESVSTTFFIVDNDSDQIRIYFFILLGAIILVGGLVLFEFYHHRR